MKTRLARCEVRMFGKIERRVKANVGDLIKTRGFQVVLLRNGMAHSAKRNECASNLRVLAFDTSKGVVLRRGGIGVE